MNYVNFDSDSEYSVMIGLLNAGFSAKQAHDAVCALFPSDDDDGDGWDDEYVWVPTNHVVDFGDTDFSQFESYEPTLEEWRFYRDCILKNGDRDDRETFEEAMEWCDAQEAIEDERNHEWERYS